MPSFQQFNRGASSLVTIFKPRSNSFGPSLAVPLPLFLQQITPIITTSSRPFSSSPTRMDSFQKEAPIHILGLGNLGKLFAHALTTSANPTPVTILTHRPGLPYAFAQSGSSLTILREGVTTSTPTNAITISLITSSSASPVKHLIVTTKAADTAKALEPLIPRLGRGSTILFTQNGMGVVDEVNKLCFPDPDKRPNYLTAIVVHGVFTTGPFEATHAAVADCKIGHTNNGDLRRAECPSETKGLMRKVVEAEKLVAKEVDTRELIAVQLEKLIANACINPLTVIFRTMNGGLLDHRVEPLRRMLCQEASAVFKAYLGSTIGLSEELEERFDANRLRDRVRGVTERTRENKSSMYQDFDAGRETEVRYINGWFAKVGEEHRIDVRTHQKLVELVEAKEEIKMADIGEVFPKTINV